MNKILIGVIAVVVIAGGAYLLFKNQAPTISPSQTSCLTQDEVAANETSTAGDSIVVRNKSTNTEVSRFALPTSTLLAADIGQCDEKVIIGTQYTKGPQQTYQLLPGGSLDQWQYAFDGTSKKLLTIISNPMSNPQPMAITFDPTKQYVSVVWYTDAGFPIKIFSVQDGTQLFATEKDNLWKGSRASTAWGQLNGGEVFKIELEGANGIAQEAVVDTKSWTVNPSN